MEILGVNLLEAENDLRLGQQDNSPVKVLTQMQVKICGETWIAGQKLSISLSWSYFAENN